MNVTVIGAGPGGYEAALYAAKCGCNVTLVEKDSLGGTCLNRGCIPTKALLAVTDALHAVTGAGAFGITVPAGVTADFLQAYRRKDSVVGALTSGVGSLMEANGVEVLRGTGSLTGPHNVAVELADGGRREIKADKIILAAGSVPAVPTVFPYDGDKIMTSDEILALSAQPGSVAIVGGGVIGCEMGQFLGRMGTKVTILEMMDHLLPTEDRDVARSVERQFRREKINFICGKGVASMAVEPDGVRIKLQDGTEVSAQKSLISIGRRPATDRLGLASTEIKPNERGFLPVNGFMQTVEPDVYAIGDIVAGTPQLAHVAVREAFTAVDHLCGRGKPIDYRAVPRCVYISPEIASVGLTEAEAEKEGILLHKGVFEFRGLGKAKAAGTTDGFAKVLTDEEDVIVGAALVGAHATDMLQVLTTAVALKMTARKLGSIIFPHPTMSEGIMEAVHDVHKMSVHKL